MLHAKPYQSLWWLSKTSDDFEYRHSIKGGGFWGMTLRLTFRQRFFRSNSRSCPSKNGRDIQGEGHRAGAKRWTSRGFKQGEEPSLALSTAVSPPNPPSSPLRRWAMPRWVEGTAVYPGWIRLDLS